MYEDEVEFTVNCKMRKRWVDDFCTLLKHMELCGKLGHSAMLAFYSDGDGDFRPKFDISVDYKEAEGHKTECAPEVMYDAG